MVTLRHFLPEDARSVRNNLYPDMTEAQIRDMIADWNTCLWKGRYFEMFAVVSDQRIVGCVSLYEHSRSMVSAGAEIYRTERRKGYASEAYCLLMAHAARKGYRLVLDQVSTDNPASIRLHEKLGFEKDDSIYINRRGHDVFLYLKLL